MKWTEVKVITSSEYEDIVTDILYEAGANGLAIEDPDDILDLKKRETDWDFIDESLMDLDTGKIVIKAYYPCTDSFNETLEVIKEKVEKTPQSRGMKAYGKLKTKELEDTDYSENWKQYFKTFKIGKNIVIKPTWENYEAEVNYLLIEIDPGMAFGTGGHETTSMCISALEKYLSLGMEVYDIGCGSGILSIVSAKLGAKKVTAIDLDEMSIKATKDNLALNQVEDIVSVEKGNLLDKLEGKVDLVVANIVAEVIVELVKNLDKYIKPNGIFITSGIIEEKIPMVEEILLDNNFTILEIESLNDWSLIVARKG